jgi:hypothetical protein
MKASLIGILLAARAARRSGFAVRVLVILDSGDLVPREPVLSKHLGSAQGPPEPTHFRFDAEL